jgi:hypothetical protein
MEELYRAVEEAYGISHEKLLEVIDKATKEAKQIEAVENLATVLGHKNAYAIRHELNSIETFRQSAIDWDADAIEARKLNRRCVELLESIDKNLTLQSNIAMIANDNGYFIVDEYGHRLHTPVTSMTSTLRSCDRIGD